MNGSTRSTRENGRCKKNEKKVRWARLVREKERNRDLQWAENEAYIIWRDILTLLIVQSIRRLDCGFDRTIAFDSPSIPCSVRWKGLTVVGKRCRKKLLMCPAVVSSQVDCTYTMEKRIGTEYRWPILCTSIYYCQNDEHELSRDHQLRIICDWVKDHKDQTWSCGWGEPAKTKICILKRNSRAGRQEDQGTALYFASEIQIWQRERGTHSALYLGLVGRLTA